MQSRPHHLIENELAHAIIKLKNCWVGIKQQSLFCFQSLGTQMPLTTRGELRCSKMISIFCSICSTLCLTLVTNPVTSHEWVKDHIDYDGNCKTFEVMTSTYPLGTLGSVASLLPATLYQGNHDYKIGICCFSTHHTAVRRKGEEWLARSTKQISLSPHWYSW